MSRDYKDDDDQDSCVLVGTSLADLMPGMVSISMKISSFVITKLYVVNIL
jgi:hypothetical protein